MAKNKQDVQPEAPPADYAGASAEENRFGRPLSSQERQALAGVEAPDELAALRARVAMLEGQLAERDDAPPAAATRPQHGLRETRRRPFRVSLESAIKGFVTPSPFFAQEHPARPARTVIDRDGKETIVAAVPADPRGQPIMAHDADEAKAIFRRLHGICGGPEPEVHELSETEAVEAMQPPPAAKQKQQRRTQQERDRERTAQAAAAG